MPLFATAPPGQHERGRHRVAPTWCSTSSTSSSPHPRCQQRWKCSDAGKVAPYILMTATFSESMLSGLAEQLGAIVVPGDDAARLGMQAPSQDKTRYYRIGEEPLSADAILRSRGRRTLVVCSVVDRATRLYLSSRRAWSRTEVVLLHSRFLPDDAKPSRTVRREFAQSCREDDKIVVAAGDRGGSEHRAMRSIRSWPGQRDSAAGGRCARYRRETGTVTYIPSPLGRTASRRPG